MEIIHTPQEIKQHVQKAKAAGKTIGLVPTMGALHEGHLSLIRQAQQDCSLVIVSVFVNPTQFGPTEDFESYPRDLDKDILLALEAKADFIFAPTPAEMYPHGYQTSVEVSKISQALCGASRPNHFKGVATVVCKLFNITKPDKAYFGQKDYQQTLVIKQMVADLNMDVQVIVMPIVRDKEGLAISSRNTYLDLRERYAAKSLYRALKLAQLLVTTGETEAKIIKQALRGMLEEEELVEIEYTNVCHAQTLEPLEQLTPGEILIALAVKVGKTRLIDNCLC